jgi:hypothetical protein
MLLRLAVPSLQELPAVMNIAAHIITGLPHSAHISTYTDDLHRLMAAEQ